VDPYRFYLQRVEEVLSQPPVACLPGPGGGWSSRAVVYNFLVRAATAYDHDADGRLALEPIGDGWRETGTFLKTIALLPFIRSLGFNTIHLLPIGAVGQDGRKGDLGSVYAVQDHYRLDPCLAEPVLGLGVEEEFAALVEAAHRLGMRVVVEFALRTAARDSVWAAEHPEWFYWVRANVPDRQPGETREDAYGAPLFSAQELEQIKTQVARGDLHDLPPPHAIFREMFTPPPDPRAVHCEGGRWIGVLPDGSRVRIPGAFADWPPDDPQPPWTDVTYLRLYDHPDFNYVAYNTVRMVDRRLARPENAVQPLWQRISEILPFYRQRFGIDGALIDMGHALPPDLRRRIVESARRTDPDFAFWDETFSTNHRLAEEGYNAVVGSTWWLVWRPEQLVEQLLRPLAETAPPLPFLAAPENHNTPRAAARPGGLPAARLAWALGCVLPAIPFCHSGFELAETTPVNTGLDFEPQELHRYPADSLPLFSAAAYGWENHPNLVGWVRRTLAARRRHAALITDPDPATFRLLETSNPHVWAVVRQRQGAGLALLVNLDPVQQQRAAVHLPAPRLIPLDWLGGVPWSLQDGLLEARLPASGCLWCELSSG